jgi:hypothetical protein
MTTYQTSSIPDVFDFLEDELLALPALTGVQLLSAPPSVKEAAYPEGIYLGRVPLSLDRAAVEGNVTRAEEYSIEAAVFVQQPGAGREVIRTVRRRAFELVAAVEEFMRSPEGFTCGGAVLFAEVAGKGLEQGLDEANRAVVVPFQIRIQARLARLD